ncbi:MAG: hypothetical protein M3Z30_08890, partial [Gemmatimonadota bacterium]|nr:hypothetical protein [Gemmatimonadota bacterium]
GVVVDCATACADGRLAEASAATTRPIKVRSERKVSEDRGIVGMKSDSGLEATFERSTHVYDGSHEGMRQEGRGWFRATW